MCVNCVQVTGEGCALCEGVLTFLDLFVEQNATENDVKDGLEKFCTLLKSSEVQLPHAYNFIIIIELL